MKPRNGQLPIAIIKASGEHERFDARKLERSIRRSGVQRRLAQEVIAAVVPQVRDGMTTAQIFALVRRVLDRQREYGAAARYALKDAMRRLGPAGYDFEKYVAEILRGDGYAAELPDLIPGECVQHEVDVVARKGSTVAMIECKYRNEAGIPARLKDVMATWARYGDLQAAYAKRKHRVPFNECWLVCNTKITSDGLAFGECKGMRLIGWQYPANDGLERMIETQHRYPITVLRSMTPPVQAQFAAAGVMLCHDTTIGDAATLARRTRVPIATIERIRKEAAEVIRC